MRELFTHFHLTCPQTTPPYSPGRPRPPWLPSVVSLSVPHQWNDPRPRPSMALPSQAPVIGVT